MATRPYPTRNAVHDDTGAIEGTLRRDDLRRAFVAGVRWWEIVRAGATLWPADRRRAEAEAERQYPGGRLPRRPRGREA